MLTLNKKTALRLKNQIEFPNFDMEIIKEQMFKELNLNEERFNTAVTQYYHFLAIKKLFPYITIHPTKDADMVWHTHILNTKKYTDDCLKFFGFYLHHTPGLITEVSGKDTKNIYNLFFGKIYDSLLVECGGDGGCA